MLVKDALKKFCDAYCPSAKDNIDKFIAHYVGGVEENYMNILMSLCADKFFIRKILVYKDGKDRIEYSYLHFTNVKNYRDNREYSVRTTVCFEGMEFDKFVSGKWSACRKKEYFWSTVSVSGMLKADLVRSIEDFEHEWIEITKEEYDQAVNDWIEYRKKEVENEFQDMMKVSSLRTTVVKQEGYNIDNL